MLYAVCPCRQMPFCSSSLSLSWLALFLASSPPLGVFDALIFLAWEHRRTFFRFVLLSGMYACMYAQTLVWKLIELPNSRRYPSGRATGDNSAAGSETTATEAGESAISHWNRLLRFFRRGGGGEIHDSGAWWAGEWLLGWLEDDISGFRLSMIVPGGEILRALRRKRSRTVSI